MLKPVSILALDDAASSLGDAVQQRVAAACGVEDLVQVRAVTADAQLADLIESIHARRQAPDSPLRTRDDIGNRELILLLVSAAGPANTSVLEVAARVRQLYEMRRLAAFYTIEVLCLLPGLFAAKAEDYGTAYSLLRNASVEPQPFDAFWLLDATNAHRVKFGKLEESRDAYAEAIAGALTLEPEMSGALPGHDPRGMDPTFSSFGYAELFFSREVALQRIESRLAAELLRTKLLGGAPAIATMPQLAAKQFVVADAFSGPLARIGVDAGKSLFKRFQPKAHVGEKTRNAEEVIAAVRAELKVYRDGTHTANLQSLAAQGQQITNDFAALLSRVVDETLDRDDYPSAIRLLEALLDPMPDIRPDADIAPRNLVTELHTATAALDARLSFTPNTAVGDATRKRIRELNALLQDQQLVADTLTPLDNQADTRAADAVRAREEQFAAMKHEMGELTLRLPDVLFSEEHENNVTRNAARDAEAARLAAETELHEQQLRELFAQKPRAEQALREMLEERRSYLIRQIGWGSLGVAAAYAIPLALERTIVHWPILTGATLFVIYAVLRYAGDIAGRLRAAREHLERIRAGIETVDRAMTNAHNNELQFEYDVVHRRTTLSVLKKTRDLAKKTLDALRQRLRDLHAMADAFAERASSASIRSYGLAIAIVEDADIDAWYERTAADRKLLFVEFPELCLRRSQSFHISSDEVRQRVEAYAAQAFGSFRALTLGGAMRIAPEPALAQRLKRFGEYSAPLIEVRDDDLPAQQAMQRDSTLWIEPNDRELLALVQRRLPDAHVKPAPDPLRVRALTRVLHYPAYVLAQIDYYRAQYDPARFPESADAPDLLPADLVLTGPIRAAYEQILLARALGIAVLRDGESHLSAAQRLASADSATVREALNLELAPRLVIAGDVQRDLRELLRATPPLSAFDRTMVGTLLKRYETF